MHGFLTSFFFTTMILNQPYQPYYAGVAALSGQGLLAYSHSDLRSKPDIVVWNTKKKAVAKIIAGPKNLVTAMAFSSDGKLLAIGSWGGEVCLYQTDSWSTITRWQLVGGVGALSFLGNRNFLLINDGTGIYAVATKGDLKCSLLIHRTMLESEHMTTSRGGGNIAFFNWKQSRTEIWNTQEMNVKKDWTSVGIAEEEGVVKCIGFDEAGKILICGCSEGRIILWDWPKKTVVASFSEQAAICGLATSGDLLLSAGAIPRVKRTVISSWSMARRKKLASIEIPFPATQFLIGGEIRWVFLGEVQKDLSPRLHPLPSVLTEIPK